MYFKLAIAGLAAAALGLSTGCQSISDSVTSPSRWLGDSSKALGDSSDASADSSNALSKSISGSSSDNDEESKPESRYREDVRVAARAWAGSEASADDFSRELGRIAERHGLLDWQARASTYEAVAAGLDEAGVPRAALEQRLDRLGRHEALRHGDRAPSL